VVLVGLTERAGLAGLPVREADRTGGAARAWRGAGLAGLPARDADGAARGWRDARG